MSDLRLIKHNPRFLTDEELEARFVVRTGELQILADIVRGNRGEVNQHALVLGPRGMGKTLLMQRLALLVRTDPHLTHAWYPIVAPEEIYDASTEGEVWLAVVKSLADQQEKEAGDFDRWTARYENLLREQDDERLKIRALGALAEFSHEIGKRLLVLIENLQMLLGEQFTRDAAWDLRKTLLNQPEIMLVFTATSRFEEIEQPGFAAYELFRELKLEPLRSEDCRHLWNAISGQDLEGQRIRPVEILTGGNPRLLSILAAFASELPLQTLLDNLDQLIDDHTPFLKSNIDALPPQERRVFVNLAKLWQASTARQVGERCRLNSNTTSAVIKSLERRGLVTEEGKEGRGKLYQVAERIYCVYYLMRLSGSEADRMRAFVRFMVPVYGEQRLARALAEATFGAEPRGKRNYIEGFRELVSETTEPLRQQVLEATPTSFLDLPEVKEWLRVPEAPEPLAVKEPDVAAEETAGANDKVQEKAFEALKEAFELTDRGQTEAALERVDGALQKATAAEDPSIETVVAACLLAKGYVLSKASKHSEEIAVYERLIQRFQGAEDPQMQFWVASALLNKGVALGKLEGPRAAADAYEQLIQRFQEAEYPQVQLPVALALLNKGLALGDLEDQRAAADAYEQLIQRFQETEDPQVQLPVARALLNKGLALGKLESHRAEADAYEQLIQQFQDAEDPKMQLRVAKALLNKGIALGDLEDPRAAADAYEQLIQRFQEAEDPQMQLLVAGALLNKGVALGDLEDPRAAADAYDQLIQRFQDAEFPKMQLLVSKALLNKDVTLGKLEDPRAAADSYDQLIQRFQDTEDPQIQLQVARALFNKGVTLGKLEDPRAAADAYDQLIQRFRNAEDPQMQLQVADALNSRAWLHYCHGFGQLGEAVRDAERAVQLDPDSRSSHHTLASLLGLAGRWEEAFEQTLLFLDNEQFIAEQLEDVLALLVDAAADDQAEAALEVLVGTAAEKAMEPLVVALKELAGVKHRAPQEVEEVKNDLLKRIEARRKALAKQRAKIEPQ